MSVPIALRIVMMIGACKTLPAATQPIPTENEVEVTAELSVKTIRIAEPIELRVQVDAPRGTRVSLRNAESTLGQFDVVDRRQFNSLPIDGQSNRRRWIFVLTLETLETGQLRIPALEVEYGLPAAPAASSSKPIRAIQTEPISITVESVLEPNQDPRAFRDIKDIAESSSVGPRENRVMWFAIGGASLIALGLCARWWWRRQRRIDPAHQAEEAITSIESQLASKRISACDAYDAASAVLRELIERTFGFPASAMSTEELRRALTERSFPTSTIDGIDSFLSEADVMKFSGSGAAERSETGFPATRVRDLIRDISEASLANEQGN